MMISKKIHLSAFGIHNGGGLVLLKALLENISDKLTISLFDARLQKDLVKSSEDFVQWIPKNFFSRWRSLNKLAQICEPLDVLFCFNSLPPTTKCSGRVIVYVQAPHFVGLHSGIRYDKISKLRFIIERFWFRYGARNVDEFWVQTESMQRALIQSFPNSLVRIRPFVDGVLADKLPKRNFMPDQFGLQDTTMFYPADGVGHKNHIVLLKAWECLAVQYGNRCPKLKLTLTPEVFARVCSLAKVHQASPYIVNLGTLKREEVLKELEVSTSLIFPSKAETFGLPLLEAVAVRIPILASERDFVRDVCEPNQTFDPDSSISIVRAVERFIGVERLLGPFVSAGDVVSEIINCSEHQ